MTSSADIHNFGKQVTVLNGASGLLYRKPRPVFWEWLLFGKDSSLKNNFNLALAKFIFNLDIEIKDEFSGTSHEILPRANQVVSNEDYFGFGVTLAYAYLFGIRDLHAENVILAHTGLQVIDCEIVLSDLVLPYETHLLPFLEPDHLKGGQAALFGSLPLHDSSQLKAILEGFVACTSEFLKKRMEILETCNSEIERFRSPIRTILRRTSDYANWGTQRSNPPLIGQEIEQLNRGDIPYFFKYLDSDSVFYFSKENEISKVEKIDPKMKTNLDRSAKTPNFLLDEAKLISKIPRGILHSAKILWGTRPIEIEGSEYRLIIKDSIVNLVWNSQTYNAKI